VNKHENFESSDSPKSNYQGRSILYPAREELPFAEDHAIVSYEEVSQDDFCPPKEFLPLPSVSPK
jgi:hypothetical protein